MELIDLYHKRARLINCAKSVGVFEGAQTTTLSIPQELFAELETVWEQIRKAESLAEGEKS